MVYKTHLADAIRIAGEKAQYDDAVKDILADRYVLAMLLQHVTEEFRGMELDEIADCIGDSPLIGVVPVDSGWEPESVMGDQNVDTVPHEGSVTFDIRFHVYTKGGQRFKLLVDVEAQKDYYPGYDLIARGIFYEARMIAGQKNTEFAADDYDGIKKVYSIWICMNAPQYAANTITGYSVRPESIFGTPGRYGRYDLMTLVMICLPQDKGVPGTESGEKLIDALAVLFADTIEVGEKERLLEEKYGFPMTRERKEKIRHMCNLSDWVEERGIRIGIEQGIEQGGQQYLIGMICRKLRMGKTPERIAEELDEDIMKVRNICSAAERFAPEYDVQAIYNLLMAVH